MLETKIGSLEVSILPALADNYIYFLRDSVTGVTAIVDPSAAAPVLAHPTVQEFGVQYILNTHHHPDHVDGNLEIKEHFNSKVVGAKKDGSKIPGIDIQVNDGETVSLGGLNVTIVGAAGHTLGHILYHFEESQVLFSGDVLFHFGCGRLFEGSPEQMFATLAKIKKLPPETQIFCGHEYTLQNARFALSLNSENKKLIQKVAILEFLRQNGAPTVPFPLSEELMFNPFLNAKTVSDFASLRKLKDSFQA